MIDVLKICSFHCSLCNNSAYFFWEVRRRHQQIQILYIDICVRNNAQYTLLGTNWIFIYRYCTYGSTIGVYNRLWWNKPCWWFLHTQFCYKVFIICQIFTRQVFNLNKWNCAFCIIFKRRADWRGHAVLSHEPRLRLSRRPGDYRRVPYPSCCRRLRRRRAGGAGAPNRARTDEFPRIERW